MFIESLESREFMSATTTLTPAVQPAAPQKSSLVCVVTTTQPQPTPQVVISIIAVLIGL